MMKIDPRQLVPQHKKEDYVPDPVQKLLNSLPLYDGILPEVDLVFDSLLKNELVYLDDNQKDNDSGEDDPTHNKAEEGDLWVRQQKKKKRKFKQ